MAVEEERVVWSGRPSWRGRMAILVPGVLLTILALVLCIWAGASWLVTVVVVALVAAVTVVWGFIETLRWSYKVTNRRIVIRHGLININEQTARLERVQDLTLHQTLFDRMFGVGSLQIDTAGSSGEPLEFKALLDPTHVREVLDSEVRHELASADTGV